MRDYSRLDAFLDRCEGEVYPEPPSEPALSITARVIAELVREGTLNVGTRVLDVGCGQGTALRYFAEADVPAVGLVLGTEDLDACRSLGLDARSGDQNFMPFAEGEFDFLWSRHCLEHSFSPAFTLTEYRRVLRPGGMAYIEVPAPDTTARHETNVNHYTVLTASGWRARLKFAGFEIVAENVIGFTVPCGPDCYFSYLARRK